MKFIASYRILFLFPLFLLTGCFEIIEDITINPDGTGHFNLTVNMSQSKGKLATIFMLDSINGKKVPKAEELQKRMAQIKRLAQNSRGIKDVKQTSDFENYIFTFSCSFASVDSLNKFINDAIRQQKAEQHITPKSHFQYDVRNMVYTRNASYFTEEDYTRLKDVERNVLAKSTVISVCRFKNNVNTTTNTEAIVSPTGKAVMLRVKALDFVKSTSTISNKVNLTK